MGPSVAHLFLVANSHDQGGLSVVAVQHDVAAIAKVNQPLPVLRLHVLHGSTHSGLLRNDLHAFSDGLHGAFGCVNILFRQKTIEALKKARGQVLNSCFFNAKS